MPVSWTILVVPPLVPTCASALFFVLYFVTKRSICRQLAMVLLLIATLMWIAPLLMALGRLPRPLMPPG